MTERDSVSGGEERGLSYCAALVRRHDRERFLTALFAPPERREALHALHAFNLEVAKTAEVVSEPMIGQIRLQWWRESLDGIRAGQPRRHAVVEPLAQAIGDHGLPPEPFERLIDARETDLMAEAPADLAALEAYAADTAGSLVELTLMSLLSPAAAGAETLEAARRAGTAYALAGLIRAIPFHARARRSYLPADLAAESGLDEGQLFELKESRALRAVTLRLAEAAERHLAAARAARAAVPRAGRAALLPAVLAGRHLKRIRKAGGNPFDPRLAAGLGAGDVIALALAARLGRY